ncbi:MAG: hypothetical protein ABI205_11180 [Gemmatimonadaceae bacterium]
MTTPTFADNQSRQACAAPFVRVGTICIVAGGLISGVSARTPSEFGSWAVAFLVLVTGVAQIALGLGQAFLGERLPAGRAVAAELLTYNIGSVLVLEGTLLEKFAMIDTGGVLLVVALVLFFFGVKAPAAGRAWQVNVYRVLIVVVLVSVPIGLVLARLRAHGA